MYINPDDVILTDYSKGNYSWRSKPATFVTLYHKPTGVIATSEEAGSLHKNTQAALNKLCDMVVEREEQMCWELYSKEG
jgi:protein subunit release factor A